MNPRHHRNLSLFTDGFTLLEILLSITVIAFICGLIVGFARLANHNARRYQARSELAQWQEALQRWHDRFGEYPLPDSDATTTNGTDVVNLYHHPETILDIERVFHEQTGSTTNLETRLERNLLHLSLKDPWGMPYHYRRKTPDIFEVWSNGPDSQPHNADDIYLTP